MGILFGAGVAWLAYVYVGYPAILFLLGATRKPTRLSEDYSPSVSVLIAARNEEKDIEWKVQQTLQWSYPADGLQVLVASDASEDRTDEIVRSITDPRLRFMRMERRSGKIAALNHLAAIAKGEVLFFTDANTGISSQSLHSMVRHFADPEVGCVTGWERSAEQDTQTLSVAGRASLGYESSINALESKFGSVLVCDGSIFCLRKSLYRQLDLELANDLELPLWVGHHGYKILYEPEARSTEKPTSSPAEEFQRRRRICAQGILGMWKLRGLLHGLRAWQFLSRKFLRWLTLIPMVMIVTASLALRSNPYFQVILGAQAMFYALALIGCGLAVSGRTGSRATSLPFYFLLLNTAALLGVVEACLGRRFSVWDIPSLSRGQQQPT
ncbi:MAG TPA: glycosyltransferase [Terriglobales bacterium]|nr:glycosyltransferase [Terriglobales bacterium]